MSTATPTPRGENRIRLQADADPKTAPKFICAQNGSVEIFDERRKPVVVQPWGERFHQRHNKNLIFIVQGPHYEQFSGHMRPLAPFRDEAVPANPLPPVPSTAQIMANAAKNADSPLAEDNVPGLPAAGAAGNPGDSVDLAGDLGQGHDGDEDDGEDFDEEEDKNAPVNDEAVPGIPGGTPAPVPVKRLSKAERKAAAKLAQKVKVRP